MIEIGCEHFYGEVIDKKDKYFLIKKMTITEPAPEGFEEDPDESCAIGMLVKDHCMDLKMGEKYESMGPILCRRCGFKVTLKVERLG